MSESFDPYSSWLGIEPDEQPVDHYQVLGVDRFEENLTVIEAAADLRMSMIRQFQTGPRGQHTQPVLNRLAAAKLCLLNGASKATYDAMLQGLAMAREDDLKNTDSELPPAVGEFEALARSESMPSSPVSETTTMPREPAVVLRRPIKASRRRKVRSKQKSNLIIAVLVIVAIAVVVWIVGMGVVRSLQPADQSRAPTGNPPTTDVRNASHGIPTC